jgi:glycosyltransferase involved in cell wall biosynthesis
MDLRISVILPVHARQESAARAIRSALSQTGPWIEIVVVDDASPEPFYLPPDLADDNRIRVLRSELNRGAAAARNLGIAAARGNWIAFLDSDDFWLPGKIEDQSKFIIRHQADGGNNLTFYATAFRQVSMKSGATVIRTPINASSPLDFASGCWFAPGSTAIVSKQAFEQIGGLDEDLRRLEDLDWALRLSLIGGKLVVAPFVGAVIEVGARPSLQMMDTACRRLVEKFQNVDFKYGSGLKRRLRSYTHVERAAACSYVSDYLGMVSYLFRSVVLMPRFRVHLRRWWSETHVSATPSRNPETALASAH